MQVNFKESRYDHVEPRKNPTAEKVHKAIAGVHTGKIPTATDLDAIHQERGGTLTVAQVGPRGLIAYNLHSLRGSTYLGVFDMNGEVTRSLEGRHGSD